MQEHHQGGIHNLLLGNTTAGVRDEQHSCMSSIYVSPCRVCMAYICKWKVHCSLVPEK